MLKLAEAAHKKFQEAEKTQQKKAQKEKITAEKKKKAETKERQAKQKESIVYLCMTPEERRKARSSDIEAAQSLDRYVTYPKHVY